MKKLISMLLTVAMILTLTPAVALAADESLGTAEGLTGGIEVTGNGDAVVTVQTTSPSALTWYPADDSVGRYQSGWWIGARVTAPALTDGLTQEKDVKYQSRAYYEYYEGYTPDGGWSADKSLYNNQDSDKADSATNFMGIWLPVGPDSLTYGKKIIWEYRFNWDRDDSYEQVFKFVADPENVVLKKDGQVVFPIAEVGGRYYQTISEAIGAAETNNIVTLLQNLTGQVTIPADKTVTLDTNGKSITNNGGYGIVNNGKLTIRGNGTVTAKYPVRNNADSSELVIENGTYTSVEGAVTVRTSNSKVTINGGTFTASDNAVISSNGTTGLSGNTITINGGTFTGGIVSSGYVACGIYAPNNDTVTVTGGTFNITGGAGIVARAGNVTVSGGTFNCTGNDIGKVGDSRVVVPCSALVFDSEANYPGMTDASKISVTGGTFNSAVGTIAVVAPGSETVQRVSVTGGTFSSNPTGYVTGGYIAKKNSDSEYRVIVKNNLSGGTYMADPSDALAPFHYAADNGDGTWTVIYVPPYIPPVQPTPDPVPEVTENPDGSTTETVTNKDGSVTETTTSKPVTDEAGNTTTTTTETVTNQDGSTVETVTETVKAADGATTETKTEVKTDADGAATTTETVKATDAAGTTATAETKTVTAADGATSSVETAVVATISTKAVTEAAAEHNVPITLPISVVAPKAGDAASTVVTVALPEAAAAESTVKVEVPVSNMTPGTVAVIIKADGAEEIMDTTMGKNGAVIALEGSVTVKIVDNSKQFKDLDKAGKWITDAADYTSARGFFNGTGDGTTFTPEGDATRGAFITVLHRMAKAPETDTESKFEDLKEGAFYTDAVKWAAANEIVMGGDGYIGVDDNITREQMVVMLYRYAEHLGLDVSARADMSEYTDADDISSWAADAVSWARAHGLMTGGGDGRIAAKANTNRAQIAAVIMRFCEFVLD